ncbi:hypothetical protein OU798_16255 [Prolixibacteraceae bacterium Z1-6]|uniref:Uncharacterized protein n=1 Tax=Draconibacterium aestuarii TaxID=2998507 RepID=A0A9X3F7F8_9BACT|nr:hypothetical protein [Prolixibacteraceae bacterium Z1-6]
MEKKDVEKTRVIPENCNSIETKKGFRDRENIPLVTSLPKLFAFKPKRKEFLNSAKVKCIEITERIITSNPMPFNGGEKNRLLCRKSGNKENDDWNVWLTSSVRKTMKNTSINREMV